MSEYQSPEILRIALMDLVLDAYIFAQAYERTAEVLRLDCVSAEKLNSVQYVLASAVEPPSKRAVDHAIKALCDIEAFDENHHMTRLGTVCDSLSHVSVSRSFAGYYLSILSLEPQLGKLVLVGLALRCLEPILTVACVIGNRDPFVLPMRADLQVRFIESCC